MKKVVFAAMVATFLFLSACDAGKAPEVKFDLGEYKSAVLSCSDAIMTETALLSAVGHWENAYWKARERMGDNMRGEDYENMVSRAMEWISSETDTTQESLAADYASLCENYRDISAANTTESSVEEIASKISELFEAYNNLYLLVTAPSGERDSFANRFDEYSNTIVNSNSLLNTLLAE